jgi:hypothetical protein
LRRRRDAHALHQELGDRGHAEEIGAEHHALDPPHGEDDEGDDDPAAPGDHAVRPEGRGHHRDEGAGEPGHEAAGEDGEKAHLDDVVADGVGGFGRLPHRAHHEAEPGAAEHPPQERRGERGEVDDERMIEEAGAEDRDVGEEGQGGARHRRHGHALVGRSDQPGEADAEDADGEARGDLVAEGDEHDEAEDRGEERRRGGAGEEREPVAAGRRDDDEAGGGGERHHPLDAEVEHAGFLDDELAEGRDQQRRRGEDGAGEEKGQ